MTFVLLDLNLVIIIKIGFMVDFFKLNVAVYINGLSTKLYSNITVDKHVTGGQ